MNIVLTNLPARMTDRTLVLSRFGPGTGVAPLYAALPRAVREFIPSGRPSDAQALYERMLARIQGPHTAVTWLVALDRELVGTTSHFSVENCPEAVEIGATCMAPPTWGTTLNTRVKHLMIRAVRDAGASWTRFRTDERNARSAAAITKLGAIRDGTVLEDIVRPDGTRRTSLLFRLDLEDHSEVCS